MPEAYDQDGLRTVHNHEFMQDPQFCRAYERGVAAVGYDYGWHWRVHVGLWVASCANQLEGDFVECGVNRGFLSSAIMEDLDWNQSGKMFYLLDTFAGVDEKEIIQRPHTQEEIEINRRRKERGYYVLDVEEVRKNFSQWRNVRIIQGRVPETLPMIEATRIAYLHLDMNYAEPEVAALEYLWDRLVPRALALFDDYAFVGYEAQKKALDELTKRLGSRVLSLPTGQGLLIKS
jgi:hypothetical protein